MRFLFLFWCLFGTPLHCETIVSKYALQAGTVILRDDLTSHPHTTKGAIERISDIVGKEVKRALYPGQPIFPRDIAQKAAVTRNQPVVLRFIKNGIFIETVGRSLSRARIGEQAKVMNLVSKRIVYGTVLLDGTVSVSN